MTEHLPTSNLCSKCGEIAVGSILKDPFGKSDTMEPRCGTHMPRFRDPADVAEIERLTTALATCQTYDYRQIIDESDRLREALLASTAEVVQLQPDALRYRWLMADADRCHVIICYAYAAWYPGDTWRETVEAESTKRGYALPAETGVKHE